MLPGRFFAGCSALEPRISGSKILGNSPGGMGSPPLCTLDEDVRRFAAERKRDREIRRAVLDGVAQQVGDGLANAVGIPLAVQVAVGAKLNVPLGVTGAELLKQIRQQGVQGPMVRV